MSTENGQKADFWFLAEIEKRSKLWPEKIEQGNNKVSDPTLQMRLIVMIIYSCCFLLPSTVNMQTPSNTAADQQRKWQPCGH